MAAGVLAAGELYQIEVNGEAFGQEVVNVIDYLVPTVTDVVLTEEALAEFRELWRLMVVNSLPTNYRVVTYKMRRYQNYSGPPAGPWVVTFADEVLLAGGVADVGGVGTPSSPTVITASARKLTGGAATTIYWLDVEPVLPTPEKAFRGRMGIGPIPEAGTDVSDGNLLDSAYRTALEGRLDDLITLPVVGAGGTSGLVMVVKSELKAGVARQNVAGAETFGLQQVTQIFLNERVGTQLSRKAPNAA